MPILKILKVFYNFNLDKVFSLDPLGKTKQNDMIKNAIKLNAEKVVDPARDLNILLSND